MPQISRWLKRGSMWNFLFTWFSDSLSVCYVWLWMTDTTAAVSTTIRLECVRHLILCRFSHTKCCEKISWFETFPVINLPRNLIPTFDVTFLCRDEEINSTIFNILSFQCCLIESSGFKSHLVSISEFYALKSLLLARSILK